MAASGVEHKDVVLALLPASAALSGLVLVFLGLVATATSSYAPGTKPSIVAKARRPAYGILFSFGSGVACVATSTAWLLLLTGRNEALYEATAWLFIVQLGSMLIATGWAVRRSLWG